MYATMVKQMLMGVGVKDPNTLALIDRIAAVGWSNVSFESEADHLRISGGNAVDSYTVILICKKKA
jgi:hypothetical protein